MSAARQTIQPASCFLAFQFVQPSWARFLNVHAKGNIDYRRLGPYEIVRNGGFCYRTWIPVLLCNRRNEGPDHRYRRQPSIGRGRLGDARALARILRRSTMPSTFSISNRLLVAALDDLDLFRPHLELVPLPHKQTLSGSNAPIDHVYF